MRGQTLLMVGASTVASPIIGSAKSHDIVQSAPAKAGAEIVHRPGYVRPVN
jgi:hypothetical protein